MLQTAPSATPSSAPLACPSREPDKLFRQLVEGVCDYAIYMLDPGGHISSWNRGAQRFKGYAEPEVLGRHFRMFYPPEDQARGMPERALARAREEGRFEDRAWRIRKDGSRFRAHVVIDPIWEPDGRLLGYAKITRDISEAYEKEQALRHSEQRFRLLVSGVTDYAIYLLDLDGRVSSWNAGAERFKGYTEPEVLGRHFSMFYTEPDRGDGRPLRALATAFRDGRYEDYGWRLRKDGRQFWAHVVIDLIRDDQGQPMGYAKITRDITERREAELRLRDLTASHQELEQFIHIASHDLREPLRKVLAFSDLLAEDEGDRLSAEGRAYLDHIQAATRRMQALLASLLELTRVTARGQPFSPCPLRQVVDEVCTDLQVMIGEREAQIDCGPLPEIEADAAQMRQLFQNLIENAIKYGREGLAPQIRIRERASPSPDELLVDVSDNGIGFEAQYAERIFGVFQRLHARDRYGGAGIGLSICRKICERHGGQIQAHAVPGEGATFCIRLPRRHRRDEP